MKMLLIDFLSILTPIFVSFSISSASLLPQILTILLRKSNSMDDTACSSVHYWAMTVIKEPNFQTGGPKRRDGFQIVKVFQLTLERGKNARAVRIRHGFIKCGKGPKKKEVHCIEVAGKEKGKEQNPCILLQQENITVPKDTIKLHLELPWALRPGMKLTAHGKRNKQHKRSQFSFCKDPKHYTAIWTWVHFWVNWYTSVSFSNGIGLKYYKGKFPISDGSNFTLSLEMTQSSTKFYADNVHVETMEYFPGVKEFYLHKFSKIYLLVVLKTGEGCDNVAFGFP